MRLKEARDLVLAKHPICGNVLVGAISAENALCVLPEGHDGYHANTLEGIEESEWGMFWHGGIPKADLLTTTKEER